jgi:hypothetical protein
MNAETILKLIERAREPLLKEAHIKAYAQAMIEKDRERVYAEHQEDVFLSLEKVLVLTPIILD